MEPMTPAACAGDRPLPRRNSHVVRTLLAMRKSFAVVADKNEAPSEGDRRSLYVSRQRTRNVGRIVPVMADASRYLLEAHRNDR
jgi:hypothetical protein